MDSHRNSQELGRTVDMRERYAQEDAIEHYGLGHISKVEKLRFFFLLDSG